MSEIYDLELEKVINKIKENNSKRVCIQLPDGLKPQAKMIQDKIMSETSAKVFIWAGSNFGACDLPLEIEKMGVDMLIHFGHSEWVYDLETSHLKKEIKK